MYIFTRAVRLRNGNVRESMAWAAEITEKVNQISEVPFSLWRPLFSPNATQLIWATAVSELEELEAVDAKLMADGAYLDLVDKGAQYGSGDPVDDSLVSFVHDSFGDGAEPQVISVVEASIANGSFARGVEVGVEIAQLAEQVTGVATAFGIHATGGYGRVQWISGHASVAEMQKAETKLNADASFLTLIDSKASEAYVSGASEQRIVRKVM